MRNNKRALYESIMNKIGSVVYNSINEMDWEGIKDKLDKDKRPVARRLGRKVGDYIQSDAYLKTYHQKMYVPKTKEELKRYIDFEIKNQGGVNVDLNMIDTRYITDMEGIFFGCDSLQTLDVSGWDTSKVENMQGVFLCCSSLQTIGDVSGWDTSKVKYMDSMFLECSSLETLDVSGWNTSKVENMQYMFSGCRKLKADISMWKLKPNCNTLDMLEGTRNIICTWDNADELR